MADKSVVWYAGLRIGERGGVEKSCVVVALPGESLILPLLNRVR